MGLPAHLKRQIVKAICLFCLSGFTLIPLLHAQTRRPRPPPQYLQLTPPDQEKGRAIMQAFRQQGLPGDYFLDLEIQVLPRRGDAWNVAAQLWGSASAAGPVSRLHIAAVAGQPAQGLIVRNGAQPQAWRWRDGEASAQILKADDWVKPIGTLPITIFEIIMPYLYWEDFVYEGLTRERSRPTHTFLLYPPAEIAESLGGIEAVRVFLDTQFSAIVKVEQIGEGDEILRTMSLLDLRKLDDEWLVKNVDFKDARSRDKVRLAIQGAALRQDWLQPLFDPATLPSDNVLSPPAKITRWE